MRKINKKMRFGENKEKKKITTINIKITAQNIAQTSQNAMSIVLIYLALRKKEKQKKE